MATAQTVTRKWPAPTAADPAMPARGSGTRLARAQRNAGP